MNSCMCGPTDAFPEEGTGGRGKPSVPTNLLATMPFSDLFFPFLSYSFFLYLRSRPIAKLWQLRIPPSRLKVFSFLRDFAAVSVARDFRVIRKHLLNLFLIVEEGFPRLDRPLTKETYFFLTFVNETNYSFR